jgi:type VI protein secretion system component Hcp
MNDTIIKASGFGKRYAGQMAVQAWTWKCAVASCMA